jgi:hypothetical protein
MFHVLIAQNDARPALSFRIIRFARTLFEFQLLA